MSAGRIRVSWLVAFTAACGTSPSPVVSLDGSAPSEDGGSLRDAGDPDAGPARIAASEIVGRPTSTSITIDAVPGEDLEGFVEYGVGAVLDRQTTTAAFPANAPAVVVIDGLAPDTGYSYRWQWRRPGESNFRAATTHAFRTQRAVGAAFRFTIQADSHLDENSDLAMYRRTLENVRVDAPDFHVDLGDTFMCEKNPSPLVGTQAPCADRAAVDQRYLYERGNFGIVGASAPIFLVNGNHDGELGYLATANGQDIATWATQARQRYFLNPVPDAFYGGDPISEANVGQRASWYSFEWGDALFVALDPFWNTKKKGSDGWGWTLGIRQYQWLAQTLGASRAKFKFVFLHNLVGGLDGQMRGGVEAAPYYEWGGQNSDGTPGFAQLRPGWGKPIHELLVDSRVSAVFHGHDHLYAKQELDGIVYQEVPQPSAKNTSSGPNLAAAYHYTSGVIQSSGGHVRVSVTPAAAKVEYVRAWLPASETPQRKNGDIADSFTIVP